METQVIKANAKINICLKVKGKRTDGYHNLDMVMASLELSDILYIEEINEDSIIINMSEEICDAKNNICYRLIEKVKTVYNIEKGIKLYIQKNIPSGAGLGGGSADAAALLKCLNKIWNLNMNVQKMIDFSKDLGSDIPFCIVEGIARVEGRGEKITPLEIKLNKDALLFVPSAKLDTKKVFDEYKSIDNRKNQVKDVIKSIKLNEKDIYNFNDLQPAADRLTNNVVKNIIDNCKSEGLSNCFMTGSGSTVVALLDRKDNISEKSERMKLLFPEITIFRTSLKMYTY